MFCCVCCRILLVKIFNKKVVVLEVADHKYKLYLFFLTLYLRFTICNKLQLSLLLNCRVFCIFMIFVVNSIKYLFSEMARIIK